MLLFSVVGLEVYDPLFDLNVQNDSKCPAPAYIYATVIEEVPEQEGITITQGQGVMYRVHTKKYKLQVRDRIIQSVHNIYIFR